MADEFLELFFVGDRLPHLFPEFHHFIDDLCLETGFPAHPSGVIHNDNRYNSGNGEFKAAAAVLHSGCGCECADSGGMGAGHAAASD